ncbi:MAG TPA: ABC transporter ATP-binding protein [Dongiaceae bacterium]|nr:ABC transporter ATP-binding protein [Dongiaceae bacterium]
MSPANPHPKLGLARLCRWAVGYACRRRGALTAVGSSMLLKAGLDVLKPWPMVFLIDYVLRKRDLPAGLKPWVAALPGAATPENLIAWCVAATVLIFLLGWILGLAINYSNITLGQRMTYDLAGDLFAKLQQLSLHFHARRAVGDSIRRVTGDCTCVSVIVKDALLPVGTSAVSLVVIFGILWRIDPVLSLLALAVVPCMVLLFRSYAGRMMDRSYAQEQAEARIYEVTEQVLAAIPVVQAFGREAYNDRQFAQATGATLAATLKLTNVQVQFKIGMGLATATATAGIFWLGAQHALAGQLTVGAIFVFLSYLASLYTPLEAIMYTGSTIQGAAGSARRVWEVLQTDTQIADRPGAKPWTAPQGRVQLENVTFGYEPDRPILHQVSLEARPGQVVALVGATGAGKSTLIGLIPRFFDPWEGRVLVDGQDVRDLQLKSLRSRIGLVLQEPFLFPLTVAENIAYGSPGTTMEQIETVARAANAHEFVTRLPQGYHTVIGERGATLSGGERQRLSIARALLKDAPILILDEPTSALDVETEQGLMEAVERLTRVRTTFIIAHRLSTIRRADCIVCLDQGRVVETGSHEALLARNGVYAHYYRLQFGGQAKT